MPSSKGKPTDPKLREQVKEEVKNKGEGGAPGQWTANKSGRMAQEYEKRGGDYEDAGDHKNKAQKGAPEAKSKSTKADGAEKKAPASKGKPKEDEQGKKAPASKGQKRKADEKEADGEADKDNKKAPASKGKQAPTSKGKAKKDEEPATKKTKTDDKPASKPRSTKNSTK